MRSAQPSAVKTSARAAQVLLVSALACGVAQASDIEVLHSWDGQFDAMALDVLKTAVTEKGHTWRDFIVVGGGGNGMATALLQARVRSGNPPSVAHIRTPAIAMWAQQGQLNNVDEVAKAENWDAQLPAPIRSAVQYEGKYVAIPLNVHRINWLWINSQALRRAGATAPATWDQFFVTAEKLKRAGFVPVAIGREQWQEHMLFQTVALGVGGAEFYGKALRELDPAALSSVSMERTLLTFRRIKQYTRPGRAPGRWMTASALLIDGVAGMQFMGDWAKPLFLQAQARSGWSFACVPAPDTAQQFLFATDAFAFFKTADPSDNKAQQDFASVAMSKTVQARFNQAKGSIPARLDVDISRFDRCGVQAGEAYRTAAQTGNLISSMRASVLPAHELLIPAIISEFWRDDRVTPAMTMARMVKVAQQHR